MSTSSHLILCLNDCSLTGVLPMHGVGLVPTVSDVVEQVAHAGVLSAFLSSAEVVIHNFVYNVVRNSTSSVWNPVRGDNHASRISLCVPSPWWDLKLCRSAFHSDVYRAAFHSPDDKINVIISDGDTHVRHVVWGAQVGLHSGPECTRNKGENSPWQMRLLWKTG